MIKMGKIEVNNKIPPKVFLFCILFSFGLFLIFGGYLISEFIKTKDYIKISSTVKNVGHYQVRNSDDFSTIIMLIWFMIIMVSLMNIEKPCICFFFIQK